MEGLEKVEWKVKGQKRHLTGLKSKRRTVMLALVSWLSQLLLLKLPGI